MRARALCVVGAAFVLGRAGSSVDGLRDTRYCGDFGGGLAYVLLAAMTATSFDRSARWLGPRRLQINGLYRHGFLIAPAMLDATMECMATGHSELAERMALRVEHAEALTT